MPTLTSIQNLLRSVLATRLDAGGREWLDSAIAATAAGDVSLRGCTMAPKFVGRALLALDDHEQADLSAVAPGVVFERWSLVDAARAVLLLTLATRSSDESFATAATDWFDAADAAEQQSWLRTLPLLPRAERFVASAVDACRTNIVPLFESIACDNPYPERHFPTGQFNQLVLKAMFVGLPLARVVGLNRRHNRELSRMATDFAAERRAAGRPTPPDLHLAISDPSPAESR